MVSMLVGGAGLVRALFARTRREGSGGGSRLSIWAFATLAVTASTGLGGCASSPPSSFYALAPIAEARARHASLPAGDLAVELGPLTFPRFLDRDQLVMRDGVRLTVDEFDRWGGALPDEFLRVWGENLAHLLGTSAVVSYPAETDLPVDYRVPAEVLGFEGDGQGFAVLKVRWAISDPERRIRLLVREDTYRRPLAADDDAEANEIALVRGLSEVLGLFSRDVADALRGLPTPSRAHAPTAR